LFLLVATKKLAMQKRAPFQEPFLFYRCDTVL